MTVSNRCDFQTQESPRILGGTLRFDLRSVKVEQWSDATRPFDQRQTIEDDESNYEHENHRLLAIDDR